MWQRLLADPGLIPYAAAAADARLERRVSGKTMTIVGFTILGVGAGAGYGLLFWGLAKGMDCGPEATCHPSESLMLGGAALMIASIATGCAIGIPGIIRMVRPSDAENEASGRYQTPGLPPMPAYPAPHSQTSQLRLPARQLSAPILSVTF